MFALTVRSLDGGCRRISVGPSLSEFRLQLEQSLPQFHRIQLFQGEHEIADDRSVEVEVQAVVTKSPDEALMTIREEQYQADGKQTEAFSAALAVLDEIEELAPAHSKQMLEIMEIMYGKCVHWSKRRSVNTKCAVLLQCFFRVCGDPSTYLTRLQLEMHPDWIFRLLVEQLEAPAWTDDGYTSGLDTLMDRHAAWGSCMDKEEAASCLKDCLQAFGSLGAKMDFIPECVDYLDDWVQRLQDNMVEMDLPLISAFDPVSIALFQDATLVLQLLRSQEGDSSVPAVANVDSEPDLATQEPPGSGDEVEQALDMAELTGEAESDPVMIHQQDLQEAIMRSKAEGPTPICYDDSVVVLRLTRCCEETLQALSRSPALGDARKRVEDAGCSLFPGKAHGACLLVPLTEDQLQELGLQLEKYHVLALRSDKPAIVEALRMVPPERRPKLRDDHRTGPIKEQPPPTDDLQGTAPAAGNDIFEEIEMLNPCTRGKIRQLLAVYDGMSESSSMSVVTESEPCGDASCKKALKLSNVNPRHWK